MSDVEISNLKKKIELLEAELAEYRKPSQSAPVVEMPKTSDNKPDPSVAYKFLYKYVNTNYPDQPAKSKIDFDAGIFSLRSSDLYDMYKSYCADRGVTWPQSANSFGKALSSLKLSNGTAVCTPSKSNGIGGRRFTRDSIKSAVIHKLDINDEETLKSLLE